MANHLHLKDSVVIFQLTIVSCLGECPLGASLRPPPQVTCYPPAHPLPTSLRLGLMSGRFCPFILW